MRRYSKASAQRFEDAARALEQVRPPPGSRPTTEAGWQRLQAAMITFAAAQFELGGASRADALRVAKHLYGGAAGRQLLEAILSYAEQEPLP